MTGGALDIGHACVERLGEEGAKVAVFDLLDAQADALVAELHGRGIKARCWHVDVTSEQGVKTAIDQVAALLGGLDVLVNNAGIFGSTKLTRRSTTWIHVPACVRGSRRPPVVVFWMDESATPPA